MPVLVGLRCVDKTILLLERDITSFGSTLSSINSETVPPAISSVFEDEASKGKVVKSRVLVPSHVACLLQ